MRSMVNAADDADREKMASPAASAGADRDALPPDHAENRTARTGADRFGQRSGHAHLTTEEKRAIVNGELDAEAAAPGKWSASTSSNGGAR